MAFDPLDWMDDELAQLQTKHLRRYPTTRSGKQAARIVVAGREYVNFGSNDYLGLAADPRLAAAASDAMQDAGWGSGASPLIVGRTSLHAELERELAAFEGTEAALLFPSGFAANVGTLASLAGPGDVIFSDAKNHASLIDGCRLSRARVQVYPHRDVDLLRQELPAASAARRRLIVTDGLFSMDGDLAPLLQLVELADRFHAILVVDEAHATGIFGPWGRGVCEHLGVESSVPVRIGTLSKALGSVGGFVVGQQRLIDWLYNRARPYVFSTAQPAASCAATLAALKIVRDEPWRRQRLLEQAATLRDALRRQSWRMGDSESQIIPLVIGQPDRTLQLAETLAQRGLLIPGIRPPSVPPGESLLRISLSYLHSASDLQQLETQLQALSSLRPFAPG